MMKVVLPNANIDLDQISECIRYGRHLMVNHFPFCNVFNLSCLTNNSTGTFLRPLDGLHQFHVWSNSIEHPSIRLHDKVSFHELSVNFGM